ncbi:Succinate-semialdehyde dehydrogenase [NADP(+)] 1 [Pseudomonas fluorescens]|uniref:GabD1 protein n=1 Tax=Pseudomonas fluorescens TaxID=294 RepID=A0A0D0TQT0_PSEFL|nr:Glyceraldehyde-3-phosphate dehydrogenase, putative [Pseudomonas synxantha]KIR24084.1 Succinate-semialdehyde dehydrogenase [NADP(+)] 1 [Pseudomonas fluorescens]
MDLDNAVSEAVTGSLSFNGQRRTALKILFVHAYVVDSFIEKFNAKLSTLKPGMPWDAGVALTPLPEVGGGLLPMAVGQLIYPPLILRHRGQAPSHTVRIPILGFNALEGNTLKRGSGLVSR